MFDVIPVVCPYCFETVELELDPDTTGELVQDCEVCCNPWLLRVTRDADNVPSVDVQRAQD
jgi:hypothetical protein